MYKLYAKTNDLGQVIDIKTQDFAGDDWTEIGETENRLYQQTITNERGIFLYEIVDGELTERDTSADDAAAIIEELRATINAVADLEIRLGCPYEQDGITKMIPATDEWESKYLVFIDMKKDGKQFSFELDTVCNADTFLITHENIDSISEAVATFKIGKIIQAQAEKRALYEV